jgi:serine/threonine-protein kinase
LGPPSTSTRDAAPQAGAVLAGKYRLASIIGRGGMGTVWRADHLGLGAQVAVKVIDARLAGGLSAMRLCQNEARAAAALRSPHVVQVLDFGLDDATACPFIVMELLDGESLADRLRRVGRLAPADTARIVTQVARALGRAHDAGIVHRDLKPANVFLVRNDDDETVKLLDFGTARAQRPGLLSEALSTTGPVVGTPYYMSPEHISGAAVDHRSDLWAVAVMACECLIGRRPFNAREIGQLVLQICTFPVPVPSQLGDVPPGLDAWFARATERQPARRFPSARALADDLRRVCEGAGAPVETRPAAPPPVAPTLALSVTVDDTSAGAPPAAAPARPRRRAWIAAGLVAVAAAALATAVLRRSPARPRPAAEGTPAAAAAAAPSPPAGPAPAAGVVVEPERPQPPAVGAPTAAAAPPAAKRGGPRRHAPGGRGGAPHARPPAGHAASPVESVLDQRR